MVVSAARLGVPAIYPLREFSVAGGLMSYGTNIAAAFRQAGIYTGRTGRLRMSGWHQTSKFPEALGANDFYAIELHPKG